MTGTHVDIDQLLKGVRQGPNEAEKDKNVGTLMVPVKLSTNH